MAVTNPGARLLQDRSPVPVTVAALIGSKPKRMLVARGRVPRSHGKAVVQSLLGRETEAVGPHRCGEDEGEAARTVFKIMQGFGVG